jgi:hypothetical protein
MPIEIKELIIRANVINNNRFDEESEKDKFKERQEIIDACINQVLKILERKKQR